MGFAEIALIAVVIVAISTFRGSRQRGNNIDLSAWSAAIRDLQQRLDATEADLDEQKRQVAELAERLDFAERRLVQVQEHKLLPPPGAR
jgi:DNA repair exonuclease SbcCD ATPase subunit